MALLNAQKSVSRQQDAPQNHPLGLREKIEKLFPQNHNPAKTQKLKDFIQTLVSRRYHPQNINVSFFQQDGTIEGNYQSLLLDLAERDQIYLQDILTETLSNGKHFEISVETLSKLHISIYGFSIGRGYLMFSYPLSATLAELKAEKDIHQQTRQKLFQLQNYCDLLPMPFWCRDHLQNIIFANKAYIQITGDHQAEMFQKSKAQILARSALLREQPQNMELSAAYGGQRYDYQIVEIPFRDHDENQYSIGIAFDVSKEHILRKKIDRLSKGSHDILQHLSVGAILFDEKRRIMRYNQAFLDLWHLTENDINQMPDHPSLLEALQLRRMLPEQRDVKGWRSEQFAPYTDPNEIYRDIWHIPTGQIIHVTCGSYAAGGLIFLCDDITEKIHFEKIHKNSIGNLQETLDSIEVDVALFNSDYKLMVFNNSLNRLCEGKLSENMHLSCLPECCESRPHITKFCRKLLETSQSYFPEGGLNDTVKDGKNIYDLRAVRLESGDIMLTFRDITVQAEYEDILSERADALSELSHVREMFFRQISFQLREPMTAISGFAEILEQEIFGPLNPKQNEYIQDMRRASGQMLELIDNMIDLVSLENNADDIRQNFKLHTPASVIESAISALTGRLKDKNITISYECKLAEDIKIQCDFTSLRQSIIQIIYNAIAASSQNSVINVSCALKGEKIIFSFKNSGTPISMERVSALEKNDTKQILQGYGLKYVKRVCQYHHAELQILPQQDGTKVNIIF
ncbi:MAG: histidine kinase dimerization/phospho-acceptor domain-containing protein [Pseudomonadota bacterium]